MRDYIGDYIRDYIRDYEGLLGLIRASWVALAPLAFGS